MTADFSWTDPLALDVRYGYLGGNVVAPRQHHPKVVLNTDDTSVLRILREELSTCSSFLFSVAFVSSKAIALLKQELVDFEGDGRIVTSDYLAFNSPEAFAELHNLKQLGIDVRVHRAKGFHPKGYIFGHSKTVTVMMGSSNLTANALVTNHEWNLKVSASPGSDLAAQVSRLVDQQLNESVPLTQDWIDKYADAYTAPSHRPARVPPDDQALDPATAQPNPPSQDENSPGAEWIVAEGQGLGLPSSPVTHVDVRLPRIEPNKMQRDALLEIAKVRQAANNRAIVISATGTGKTILSALDVRAANPQRFLFVVHREQILDRTIQEYQRVLGGPATDYGKLSGSAKQYDNRYLFATVQTLSQTDVLARFAPDAFDYIIIDEAHRAGAPSHQRVIEHFRPEFLLGMTATPERTDGFNVFELFHYNVPYEIRLNHALEEDMLSPFHYYGVADVTFEGGVTTTDETDLKVLISAARVQHLVSAITIYGQAGVAPRGLIFCSRKDEAHALSAELNKQSVRGQQLRTLALTGDDTIPERDAAVERLERGEIDYILTVDIFNEGVDIPSVNQVIMLRQTHSAIVFVQQLGRGLRKFDGKEYLVVIDFIGNYTNNYLIPIALFGNESLNKESLRQDLIAAEEVGVLPGLSSVRFDRISQERVLSSIVETRLDSFSNLKFAVETMRNRLGQVPALYDFLRFESVDPVLLATKVENYPKLIERLLRIDSGLSASEHKMLGLVSHEVLTAKRSHEFILLRTLLDEGAIAADRVAALFAAFGLPATTTQVNGTIDTFTLELHSQADQNRYGTGIVTRLSDGSVALHADFVTAYQTSAFFAAAVDDIIRTGLQLVADRYIAGLPFTPGRQYSRKDTTRLLGLPRKWVSTLYGYKVDPKTATCPIFVTLHKSEEVTASTAYEDALLDSSTMLWYTKSRRTLASAEIRPIIENKVELHVFVKKDDAEGSDFYYLGRATAHDAEQTTMAGTGGAALDVVRMRLRFDKPIEGALYDYFHPTVTA